MLFIMQATVFLRLVEFLALASDFTLKTITFPPSNENEVLTVF